MRVLILTIGSRGDVQPFVALGVGMKTAGHDVMICTGELYVDLVKENGLGFSPMNDEIIRMADTSEGRKLLEGGGNMIKVMIKVKPLIKQQLEDGWNAAREFSPDLIIYHPKTLSGYHIAEKLSIPVILSIFMPTYTPTKDFPVPLLPFNMGGSLNKQSYKLVRSGSASYNGIINELRSEMGLEPVGHFFDEMVLPDGRNMPAMYGYSNALIPRPSDWPETTVATGHWFLKDDPSWKPPDSLRKFLADGPPPVCVGFGSMTGTNPEKAANIAVEALKRTGQRGILVTGWGGLAPGALPDSIIKIEGAPYDWLLPQAAAVVHHGGCGTTHISLKAGKPTMICPFFGDQPFWGKVVHGLGAGPEPVKLKKLTVEELAAGIEMMTDNDSMKKKAAEIGKKLKKEDGIANALAFMEKMAV